MENSNRIRMAGTLYTVGGALWLRWIVGWSLLTSDIPAPDSQFFYLSEIGFIIIQSLLFIGFFGIWWSQGVRTGLFGKIAFGLGLLGHFLFILAELFSLATGSEDLLPVAALTSTIGLILLVIAGLSILSGYRPEVGVTAVVLFMVPVSVLMHNFWAVTDPQLALAEMRFFLSNMGLAGSTLLFLAIPRPWPLSINKLPGKTKMAQIYQKPT